MTASSNRNISFCLFYFNGASIRSCALLVLRAAVSRPDDAPLRRHGCGTGRACCGAECRVDSASAGAVRYLVAYLSPRHGATRVALRAGDDLSSRCVSIGPRDMWPLGEMRLCNKSNTHGMRVFRAPHPLGGGSTTRHCTSPRYWRPITRRKMNCECLLQMTERAWISTVGFGASQCTT